MKSDNYQGREHMEAVIANLVKTIFVERSSFIPTRPVVEISPTLHESLKLENIQADASYMIKFTPDYLITNKNHQNYFVDLKFSRAPLFIWNRINQINQLEPTYKRYRSDNIGLIAREAFYSYRKYFPKMIVLYATPYNSKILMAQHIENIKPLYVGGADYDEIQSNEDFLDYEINTENYFELNYNPFSTGSGTQHINIDLDSFLPIEEFFDNLNIETDTNELKKVKESILTYGIDFSRARNEKNSKDFFENIGYPWKI